MKKLILLNFLFFAVLSLYAQERAITTFILIRHAEKDLTQSTSDPDLSVEGKARAANLVNVLRQTDIHAVYSTDFKRTRQTVEPIANSKSVSVTLYDSKKNADIDAIIEKHRGETILVSGHSNTIPAFANYLIGEDKFKPMGDGEYGNIIVISMIEKGKNSKVVWLSY